jgi:cytochrome c biogenesis protein CcdA
MTHLPFIAGAYALGIALPLWLAIDATLRLGRARRRLAAVETRRR